MTIKYDIEKIRNDFPILKRMIRGKSLVYLDNAATSQKPQNVIDALQTYYTEQNSNVHRGVHYLSQEATLAYEGARSKIRQFINAKDEREIIYTRGTTDGINLVAQTYGRKHIQEGDEIIISAMEHHSNIVPWQLLCEEKKAILRVISINDEGELILDEYEKLLNEKTKFVSIAHISNSLGTINPVKKMIEMAHERQVPVLIDGAQAVPHQSIDVQDLDCDFFAFSGHKMYASTGSGVLYGKRHLLEDMPPYQGGGDMISAVTFEKTTYNELPHKFEAGTPNISAAISLGAAIDYLEGLGLSNIAAHENEVLQYATNIISQIEGVQIIGTAKKKAAVISFVIDNAHPHDIGTLLDMEGIAIRAGHHCTQPIMDRFCIPATARASLGLYNTKEEMDILAQAIHNVIEVFN